MTLKNLGAFKPGKVDYLHNEEAIRLAAELDKPIYGPADLRRSIESTERLGHVFYFPQSKKTRDYAMLLIFDNELQDFLNLAKEKDVTIIPIPFVITLGEKVEEKI